MCGDTFDQTIEVRYPVGAADVFVRQLPRIWPMKRDIAHAYSSLEDDIAKGIESATLDLDAYLSTNDVDQTNFDAIDAILDAASTYLEFCTALRQEWADRQLEYVDSGGIDEQRARSWLTLGLHAETPATLTACEGAEPDTVMRLDLPEGGWVEYRCPGLGFTTLYEQAWARYKDTLTKAAKQTRCAQEGLYSLVAYNVNRKQGEVGPPKPEPSPTPEGTLRPAPPKKPVFTPAPIPSPTPPAPEAEAVWPTWKKVAVGAVVVGAVAGIYALVARSAKKPEAARVTNWTYPEELA